MKDAVQHIASTDETLAEIIELVDVPPFESSGDVFADLVCCMVEQQIPYRARGYMLRKLMELISPEPLVPEAILRIDLDSWRAQKLSAAKYSAVTSLADSWLRDEMQHIEWLVLSDQEVRDRLGPLKGVGGQTLDMILLYTLERSDIFPANDYHLKRIMAELYSLPSDKYLTQQMAEIARAWAPYRSLAVRYLLAYKQLKR